MTTLLLLPLLTACQSPEPPNPRIPWFYDRPEFRDDRLPVGLLKWAVVADEEGIQVGQDVQGDRLPSAFARWRRALSCSFDAIRVPPQEADVIIRCHPLPPDTAWVDANLVMDETDDRGRRVVRVSPEICMKGPDYDDLHIAGHAVGALDDGRPGGKLRTYNTSMTIVATYELPTMGIDGFNPVELDGLMIWSRQKGAPGCPEGEEYPWSWDSGTMWNGHPATPPPGELPVF